MDNYKENLKNWIEQQKSCIKENDYIIQMCESLIETNNRLNENYTQRIVLVKQQSKMFQTAIEEQEKNLSE